MADLTFNVKSAIGVSSGDNGVPRFQINIDIPIDILISGRMQNIVKITQVIEYTVFLK